jgi:uncharacterized protein (TIGR00730 family)
MVAALKEAVPLLAPAPTGLEGSVWPPSTRDPAERRFLQGPHTRRHELRQAMRIFIECIRGFRALHFVGPCVTVFGSARFDPSHPFYALGEEVGSRLAEAGLTVMTGGGPGLMEAANRGAKLAGGRSIGCNIRLPKEQKPNAYLDRMVEFRYFFIRKLMLVKYSYAFVALPGGLGTLDEIFETSVLIQTGKVREFPLILLGVDFWKPLVGMLRDRLLPAGTVDRADVDRVLVTDSPSDAVAMIRETAMRDFGLTYGPRVKPRWYLGEWGHADKSSVGAERRIEHA